MLPRCVALGPLIVLSGLSGLASGAEPEVAADESVLRAAHLPADELGLLAFFRIRTITDETCARIQTLIAQLGSDSFALREQASTELVSMGPGAASLLAAAARHHDLEIRWRARQALADIRRDSDPDVLVTAVRVLGRLRPAETAEVLLAYLPCAEDADVAEEACLVLASVAVRDGKAEPLLVRALTDPVAIKRGAAGAALCRAGGGAQQAAVRRLLRDRDPLVRRRVASALLEAREKNAIPVLIALLAEVPPAEAERIEELLFLLAGDKAAREPGRRRRRSPQVPRRLGGLVDAPRRRPGPGQGRGAGPSAGAHGPRSAQLGRRQRPGDRRARPRPLADRRFAVSHGRPRPRRPARPRRRVQRPARDGTQPQGRNPLANPGR